MPPIPRKQMKMCIRDSSKDQAENLLDDGQISPSEYAEDKVRYMAEDTAREVGHEAGKLTGKAKSVYRTRRDVYKRQERHLGGGHHRGVHQHRRVHGRVRPGRHHLH